MKTKIMLALLLGAAFWPASGQALTSGEKQAQWAAHGFKHGAWDCYGRCPEGRRPHRHR